MAGEEIDFSRVALFPLPETVFFPRTQLPLHIFEPRYRRMTEECLAGGMAMAVGLARPGQDLAGHAEVFPVAGVGRIERHNRHPDGRFDIVLQGLSRMRIAEELPSSPFRCVRGVPLADDWPGRSLEREMSRLKSIVERVATLADGDAAAVREMLRRVTQADGASLLADTVAAMLVGPTATRQGLLEELSVEARLTRVTDCVAELLLRAEAARRGPDEPLQ